MTICWDRDTLAPEGAVLVWYMYGKGSVTQELGSMNPSWIVRFAGRRQKLNLHPNQVTLRVRLMDWVSEPEVPVTVTV